MSAIPIAQYTSYKLSTKFQPTGTQKLNEYVTAITKSLSILSINFSEFVKAQ